MKCPDIRELVTARPHLTREEWALLRDHLAGCPQCAAYCRRDDETRQLLQRLPEPPPARRRSQARFQGASMRTPKLRPALTFAALLIALAVGGWSLLAGAPSRTAAPRHAPAAANQPSALPATPATAPDAAPYPSPQGTPQARNAAPYPGPQGTPQARFTDPYPSPAQGAAAPGAPAFVFHLPLQAGAPEACGTGPAGVPIRLVNITRNAEPIGETVIDQDGRFCIAAPGDLPRGDVVGLMIGDLSGTDFKPEQFLNGLTYIDMPMVGVILTMAPVMD